MSVWYSELSGGCSMITGAEGGPPNLAHRALLGLGSLDVDPALELLALPAARARVVQIDRRSGAGLAADAGVALVVQGHERDAVLAGVAPHVAIGPRRQGRDALDDLSAR